MLATHSREPRALASPTSLSSWNQRALDSNAATHADSLRVGASLFAFPRLSFPT